jgi:hypothetical protein
MIYLEIIIATKGQLFLNVAELVKKIRVLGNK